MAVVRSQYGLVSASYTATDNATTTVDIPRPQETMETNTIDFVKRVGARKDHESGRASVSFDSTLGVSGLNLCKVEILSVNPGTSIAPLNLSFSQFPETPVAGIPVVLRTLVDITAPSPYTLDLQVTKDILTNILLRTGEYIRLTINNPAGGAGSLTGRVFCRYDLGLNAGNYGSLPLLI